MKVATPLAALALVLLACTTQQTDNLTTAATTPLSDLNLVNASIPAPLQAAQRAAYAQPASADCAAVLADIRALDEVLGADLDTPPSEINPGLIERGSALVAEQATHSLRRTAEGLIPFRSWVRKLTGAERYSKQVASAIAAGTVRRAFLKGIAVAQGCRAA